MCISILQRSMLIKWSPVRLETCKRQRRQWQVQSRGRKWAEHTVFNHTHIEARLGLHTAAKELLIHFIWFHEELQTLFVRVIWKKSIKKFFQTIHASFSLAVHRDGQSECDLTHRKCLTSSSRKWKPNSVTFFCDTGAHWSQLTMIGPSQTESCF